MRDANGGYLGRNFVSFGGDSTVTIQADGALVIGQDITAGKTINIIGGAGVGTEPGLKLQGSARLRTLRPDGFINLNAPGEVVIQAPAHINEIMASGFIHTNDGKLTSDIVLPISVNRVDFSYRGNVTISAADTADNTGIADLVSDLQAALSNATYTVFNSQNANYPDGSTFTEVTDDPSTPSVDPDLQVKLRDGKLVLTAPYEIILNPIELLLSVTGAEDLLAALGFDTTSGPLTSSQLYAIDALQPGSIVNIGAPAGPNGKLTIEGKVRADNAINLYSGTSPDGVDIDLGPSGQLETINGSIEFNAGQRGDIRGSIIAGGSGSDIVLNSAESLRIRGHLTANDDILLSAGSQLVAHQVSVQIDGTSQLNSAGGGGDGEIIVTGFNDIVFDGVLGTGSNNLSRFELNAVHGNLTIPKTSGRIESDALIFLKGAIVDVQGVVRSTLTTPSTNDFEITIDASDTAIINGQLELTGSLHIDADNLVEVFNTTINISEPNQRVLFSGGDVRFGKASTDMLGQPVQLGALVTSVDRIEFNATGNVEIGSGSVIATSAENSLIDLTAGSVTIAGSLLAGASIIDSGTGTDTVFSGAGADIVINAQDTVALGGTGIINGASQTVGGTLNATGDISITVAGGTTDVSFTMNELSSFSTQTATGEGANAPHSITINAAQDVRVVGSIQALQTGADISITSSELLLIDGLVKADDQLTLNGGSDETGFGLIIQKFVFATDANGNELLDSNGQLIRLHGGTVTTNPGGTLTLSAQQQLALSGVIGETHTTNNITTADVATIRITDGYVIVDSSVIAADRIDFDVDGVMIAPNGVVQTINVGGAVDLRASGLFMMAATTAGALPATIQSDVFVHVMGGDLSLDGLVLNTSPTGRILIDATNSATFYGNVTAKGALAVHAGVSPFWTDGQLFGAVTIADLNGGNITINGGLLSSEGTAEIIAGGNVEVIGSTSVGSDLVTVKRPVINTTTKYIDIVTGTRQVAVGTVLVPEVTFVTTTSTQQVGTESVRVGSAFNTAEISLLQLGYYNATTGVTRKTFIEGIDYTNAGLTDAEWARSYDEATGDIINVGSVRPIGNTDFQQLTDEQRNAVLIKLGFRPLYNMSLTDLAVHRTINGIPTTDAWHPKWEGQFTTQVLDTTYEFTGGSDPAGIITYQQYANRSVVRLAMDGLRDKYVIVPTGADADFLKVCL